jgi:CheY-like chemotaxis protein
MQERAEELGGTMTVTNGSPGVTVQARLPTRHHARAGPQSPSHRIGAGMTRVLMVHDYPLFRDGLATLLATAPRVEVVGTAGTAGHAITAVRQAAPDVVLMVINLPPPPASRPPGRHPDLPGHRRAGDLHGGRRRQRIRGHGRRREGTQKCVFYAPRPANAYPRIGIPNRQGGLHARRADRVNHAPL